MGERWADMQDEHTARADGYATARSGEWHASEKTLGQLERPDNFVVGLCFLFARYVPHQYRKPLLLTKKWFQ